MRMLIATEPLRCPRCKRINYISVYTDASSVDWIVCKHCDYKALMHFGFILDKYCVLGINNRERYNNTKYMQREVNKIG